MLANEVRPGPNRYITGDGVLSDLPEYLSEFQEVADHWGAVIRCVFSLLPPFI